MTTEQRLTQVEQELWRTRRRTRLLLTAAAMGALFCAQPEGVVSNELWTKKLVVVGTDAQERAVLTTHDDGSAVLFFYDEGGTQRIGPGVGADGTGLLAMFGENTLTRVMLHGADSTGALTLCDAEGNKLWSAP